MTLEQIKNICDNQGFWVNEDNDMFGKNEPGWEIGKGTPEGEDWFETIATDTADVFVDKLKERIDGWDSEEEAMPYIEMRGTKGVPNSIKDLLDDADWKKSELEDLLNAIENAPDVEEVEESKELIKEEKLNFIENVDELPDMCYGVLPSDNSIIIIKKGEKGYYLTDYNDMVSGDDYDARAKSADEIVNKLNAEIDITPDQRFTMEIRSMNGNWETKKTENKITEEVVADREFQGIKYFDNKDGWCPVCNTPLLYDARQIAGKDMVYFPWECDKCGTKGEEWFKEIFQGHSIINEDDDSIDLPFEGKKEENKKLNEERAWTNIEDAILDAVENVCKEWNINYERYTNLEMNEAIKYKTEDGTFYVAVEELYDVDESKKEERNLTRAERHNRNMDKIFDTYDKQIARFCEFLKRLGYSEEEITDAKNNTGLGAHKLWDLAQPEAEKLGPDVWHKLCSLDIDMDEILPAK